MPSPNVVQPASKKKRTEEEEIEQAITGVLASKSDQEIGVEAKLSADGIELLESLQVSIVLNQYCSPGQGFDVKYVKHQFTAIGFSVPDAARLYMYFQTKNMGYRKLSLI